MALYYKYVEEYLQYSLISIAGKSKFSLEKVERLLKCHKENIRTEACTVCMYIM
jgi:hypothetical protein